MRSKGTTTAVIGALIVLMMAGTASAGGAQVTGGDLQSFAAGLTDPNHQDIDGQARMVRTASGQTLVMVTVSHLIPGATYGSHVHSKPCDDEAAGGHYRFDTAGVAGAVDVDLGGVVRSEIWPGPLTANAAGRAAGWTSVGATAGPGAVSVVIHASDTSKIACADLG